MPTAFGCRENIVCAGLVQQESVWSKSNAWGEGAALQSAEGGPEESGPWKKEEPPPGRRRPFSSVARKGAGSDALLYRGDFAVLEAVGRKLVAETRQIGDGEAAVDRLIVVNAELAVVVVAAVHVLFVNGEVARLRRRCGRGRRFSWLP